MPSKRDDPFLNFQFVVEIDGATDVAFSEVTLPSFEVEVILYRDGSDKTSVARKLPGRTSYSSVTLRRGITGDTELSNWSNAVRDGVADRRNVAIVLMNEKQEPVQRWLLRDAWPTKIEFGPLNALGNEVVIESLELAHEGFTTEVI